MTNANFGNSLAKNDYTVAGIKCQSRKQFEGHDLTGN